MYTIGNSNLVDLNMFCSSEKARRKGDIGLLFTQVPKVFNHFGLFVGSGTFGYFYWI